MNERIENNNNITNQNRIYIGNMGTEITEKDVYITIYRVRCKQKLMNEYKD